MKKFNPYATDTKKQHTVPRFLLDNFGFGKKNKKRRLYTFDKFNSRTYQQSVYDATTRNVFYNIIEHPEDASLEPILGKIESEAAAVIKKIIEKKDLSILSDEDKEKISTFVIIQKSRTFHGLKSMEFMMDSVFEKVSSMGIDPEYVDELSESMSPNNLKNTFLSTIIDNIEHAKYILEKDWILYETTEENPFYISDNPVTLHNDNETGLYGNLGLAVEGIQIHLPLSSTLTLTFTCSTIKKNVIHGRDNFKIIRETPITYDFKIGQIVNIYELAEGYEKGTSINADDEHVRFLNSLQVLYAEQYVFNKKHEFNLVEEMLSKNNGFRQGRRMQIN